MDSPQLEAWKNEMNPEFCRSERCQYVTVIQQLAAQEASQGEQFTSYVSVGRVSADELVSRHCGQCMAYKFARWSKLNRAQVIQTGPTIPTKKKVKTPR